MVIDSLACNDDDGTDQQEQTNHKDGVDYNQPVTRIVYKTSCINI